MPPEDNAHASVVIASSILNLQAEVAKHTEEANRNKAAGRTTLIGGIKRTDKKTPKWMLSNPGVHARAVRDIEQDAADRPKLGLAKMKKKAHIYKQLKKGNSGGLNDQQLANLLVNFDEKADMYESDSDDVDESLTVPVPPSGEKDDDPIIEYADEFGRTRTARRSEIPLELLPKSKEEVEEDDDPDVVYNPVGHFPVYEPDHQAIREKFAEDDTSPTTHYDASRENRAKGAAFYNFSRDEERRKEQMADLSKAREETKKNRSELGAPTVQPGEAEGMLADGGSEAAPTKSRGMEKRKREREERMKQLEAKRRKKAGQSAEESTTSASARSDPVRSPPVTDPFAQLERQSNAVHANPHVSHNPVLQNPADAFLAQLEQEIVNGQGR